VAPIGRAKMFVVEAGSRIAAELAEGDDNPLTGSARSGGRCGASRLSTTYWCSLHEPECQLVNHVALVHQLSPASEVTKQEMAAVTGVGIGSGPRV
jgi:hypothetical protein